MRDLPFLRGGQFQPPQPLAQGQTDGLLWHQGERPHAEPGPRLHGPPGEPDGAGGRVVVRGPRRSRRRELFATVLPVPMVPRGLDQVVGSALLRPGARMRRSAHERPARVGRHSWAGGGLVHGRAIVHPHPSRHVVGRPTAGPGRHQHELSHSEEIPVGYQAAGKASALPQSSPV